MGWGTALKVIGTVAGAIGSSKSRPKKGDVEKFSPLEAGNILIGKEKIERFNVARDRMTNLAKKHFDSPGVKSLLAGKQRADIAQASAKLSYANASNPSQAVVSTKAEAELAGDLEGMAAEFDLNKSLEYVNRLAGTSGVISSSRAQLGDSEASSARTSYLAKLNNAATTWGMVAGTSQYLSSFDEDEKDETKKYNKTGGRGYYGV